MSAHLKGKRAIVTGGTGGIGSEVVRQLAAAGVTVTAASLDSAERCAALKAETGAQAIHLDVADREACMRVLEPLNADILVNAAGALGQTGTLFDQPVESARRLLDVNILGVQNCLQAVVPGMIARDEGHVVLLGSVAGPYPSLKQPIYSATKAAVHSMAFNLRMELFGTKVRVTEIRPGRTRTGMHAEMFGGSHEEANRLVYDPVETLAASEVAEAVLWALAKPPRICVTQIEVVATDHVIGGVRYKGM
jgi:NADP-dependent 3-hydroxy acid dehydrogenase YdfG